MAASLAQCSKSGSSFTLGGGTNFEWAERAVLARVVQQRLAVVGARFFDQTDHDGVVAADEDLVGQTLDVREGVGDERYMQRRALFERAFASLVGAFGGEERGDLVLAGLQQAHPEGVARDHRA